MRYDPKITLTRDYLQGAIDWHLYENVMFQRIDYVEYRFVLHPDKEGVLTSITVKLVGVQYATEENQPDLMAIEEMTFYADDTVSDVCWVKVPKLVDAFEVACNKRSFENYKPI
jgi:hypothetical protein